MSTQLYLSLVADFHAAMLYRQPEPPRPSLDNETCALRVRLIQEELDELMAAIQKEDTIEQLDACCDLQYVISGAVLALGFRSFHGAAIYTQQIFGETECISGFHAAFAQFQTHLFNQNIPGSYGMLARCELRLGEIVKSLGFDAVFADAFREVHRSNLTKTWSGWEVHQHAGQGLSFMPSGEKFIARRVDGKIIKSPSYSPAKLEQFIAKSLA